jgi:DNA-binding transcriptional LysR family regulator
MTTDTKWVGAELVDRSGLRIVAGHTIALSFLPTWLNTMSAHFSELRARIIPTNVHDSVLMLVNGSCELMFAYHHPGLPLHLDPLRYESLTVGRDVLMPVCKPKSPSGPLYKLPGTARKPLPHISYAETTYFGRCVAHLLARWSDCVKPARIWCAASGAANGGDECDLWAGGRQGRLQHRALHERHRSRDR